MINFRTDLAVEAKEMYVKESKRDIDGISVEEVDKIRIAYKRI